MFRALAALIHSGPGSTNKTDAESVFQIHPIQLSRWLEQAWFYGKGASITWAGVPALTKPFLGSPDIFDILAQPTGLRDNALQSGIPAVPPAFPLPPIPFVLPPGPPPGSGPAGLPWEHLVYALLIENTGVLEIFSEVARRYAVGETLEVPSLSGTIHWLRATEELFFRDPPLFQITGITSALRPDLRISRRNAYWRLFGMDLAHPLPPQYTSQTSAPWKTDVGIANLRFREVWVELLREVWIGMENMTNTSGAKATDDSYIAELASLLSDMLGMRRKAGVLAREEFVHVTWLSWFHLTLEYDTSVVSDLKGDGEDPADRLIKIGRRVGITAPPHAREYFELADVMSTAVRFLELGAFNDSGNAQLLYDRSQKIGQDMNKIIDLWQLATGDRIKDLAVREAGRPRMTRKAGRVPIGSGLASVGAGNVPASPNGSARV